MWANPQFTVDLATFTEEILYEKLHFLCSDAFMSNNIRKRQCALIKKSISATFFQPKIFGITKVAWVTLNNMILEKNIKG